MSTPTLADLKAFGNITISTDDVILQICLDQSIDLIARVLGLEQLIAKDYTEIIYLPYDVNYFIPKNYPINSITSIKTGDTTLDSTVYITDDTKTAIYKRGSLFLAGKYTVIYNAGWATLPKDLDYCIFVLALRIYQTGDPGAVWSMDEDLIPKQIHNILEDIKYAR